LRWLKDELTKKEELSGTEAIIVRCYRKMFRIIFTLLVGQLALIEINLILSSIILPPPGMPLMMEIPGTE
jgi:hypothetical protein